MDKINYALAPSDATDYDFFQGNYFWLKKTPNGEAWRYFDDDRKEWRDCFSGEEPSDPQPIPEREIALNRLADNYVAFCQDHRLGITNDQVKDRRALRIEAGVIKQNKDLAHVNDTDVVEMEWINGLPTVGVECMYRDTYGVLDKATKKQMWSDWQKCRIEVESKDFFIVTVIDQHGCDDYEYPAFKGRSQFVPIKTAEQIAAEKKNQWSVDALKAYEGGHKMETLDGVRARTGLDRVYDALLNGELEAPKVGDV